MPDEGFAYSFQDAELSIGSRIITAISNVSIDQPTTEGVVMGTRAVPLKRTRGSMSLGEGTITFSDEEERQAFLDELGDGYREKTFEVTWTLSAQGNPKKINYKALDCRLLSNPVNHESGEDALGGEITFSFLNHTINGQKPHTGIV